MFAFRLLSRSLLILFFLSLGCSGQSNTHSYPTLKSDGYSILLGETDSSERWGDYLYQHLLKRCSENGILLLDQEKENFKKIRIEVNQTLNNDYCIEHTEEEIVLKAQNDKTIIWLIYQFIKQLSNSDKRFASEDLPPAIMDFYTMCKDFDFTYYREPYFRPNLENEYAPIIGTHCVESEWGLWGHNLGKILSADKDNSIFARVDDKIDKEQLCFSNEEIFRQTSEYIIDNFGNDPAYTQRFMIMPNDNGIACNCNLCKSHGNTLTNATPAVSKFITRLATDFPHHSFFTSAYLSTMEPPKEKIPHNTGVIISTIELPKGIELDQQAKEVKRFLDILEKWKKYTSNIYIWDYAANFDDYLTPVPVLYGLQKQLRFYKQHGVKGVFLNASGYDYLPFDDMKTFVAGALMIDIEQSVDKLCRQYFTQYYPLSGAMLSDYYLSLEKELEQKNKPYNIYAGFGEIRKSYLDEKKFMKFYDNVNSFMNIAKGEEKLKLRKLFTAITFTRLQIAYFHGQKEWGFATLQDKEMHVKPDIRKLIELLSEYQKYNDFSSFKEFGGGLDIYLKNWEKLVESPPLQNLLIGKPIEVVSKTDEGYRNIESLTDGVLGFDNDYHQGWHLSTNDDLHIEFDTQSIENAKSISFRFMVNKRHRMYPPQQIEIFTDGSLYKKITPDNKEKNGIVTVKTDIDLSGVQSVSLKIYRSPQQGRSTLACDEILLN